MESESLECGMVSELSGGMVSELRGYGMESCSGVGSVSPEMEGDSCEHGVFCEGGEGRFCEDERCECGKFGICEGVS